MIMSPKLNTPLASSLCYIYKAVTWPPWMCRVNDFSWTSQLVSRVRALAAAHMQALLEFLAHMS